MKKGIVIISVIGLIFGLTGCDLEETAETTQRKQTAAAMKEANNQIGMPAIKNFQERKLAKMIFELRDQEKLITYAYLVNKMSPLLKRYIYIIVDEFLDKFKHLLVDFDGETTPFMDFEKDIDEYFII